MPSSLENLSIGTFSESGLEYINFGSCQKLTKLEKTTFYSCRNLTQIILPPKLQTVSEKTFEKCSKLTSISFPNTLVSLGISCFSKCNSLQTVEFNDAQFTEVPQSCFKSCDIRQIKLPESVISIDQEAFKDNELMSSITFGTNSRLASIQVDAFAGCNKVVNIELGKEFKSLSPGGISQMGSLVNISVDQGNNNFCSVNGVLYDSKETVLISFPGGITSFTLNDKVQSIASRAFFGCSNLEKLEFTEDGALSTIGGYTFYGCSKLASLALPASVSRIESQAFGGCLSLENVTFNGESLLEEIVSGIFDKCDHLKRIVFNKGSNLKTISANSFLDLKSLEEFRAPPSLKKIGMNAFKGCSKLSEFNFSNVSTISSESFYGCGLKKIYLTSNIEIVEEDAFRACKNLQSVTYCGESFMQNDIFPDYNGAIYVQVAYPGNLFAGKAVVKALDKDCNFPTWKFTAQNGSDATQLLAASLLSDGAVNE